MFPSPQQIALSREQALSHLLDLSASVLDTSQRLSALFSANSQEAIAQGSQQLSRFSHGQLDSLTHFPASVWLENSRRHGKMLEACWHMLGETQHALIRHADAQLRVVDAMTRAGLRRAMHNAPWEVEIALDALLLGLDKHEQVVHELNDAALSEAEQTRATLQPAPAPAPNPTTTRRRASPRKKSQPLNAA
ncbi:MAG: hypothetical protein D3M94_17445 [Rhodocyclales bacterium GT-UBC]|nr:MAG: hypothetical protein D3M94_17445 [Rhodocyclales bacterium GT-UBC]